MDKKTQPIGFFDSGVGGLSVFARFREILPNENVLYFGDLLHLPYGNKSKNELVLFARNILNFYKSKDVKSVIIACNTSSAQAYETIKDEYDFKIYPIIQSCAKVIAESGVSRIGVFATEATVNSKKYTQEILKYNNNIQVREIACKDWVSLVENTAADIKKAKLSVKNKVTEMMEFKPDKIILGCTHFPYLIDELEQYASKDIYIDPAKIFVEFIKKDMKEKLNPDKNLGYEKFYVSSSPENFVKNSRIFYNVKSKPEIVKF